MGQKLTIVICTLMMSVVGVTMADLPDQFPPVKPLNPPEFEIPAVGRSLDEPWAFVDTLFDAERDRPDLYGAFPVDLEFTHNGRGFMGMLHTVFHTADAGLTWTNLDRNPPPSASSWSIVRSPAFIGDLAIRPTENPMLTADSVFLAIMNADGENGFVDLIRNINGTYILWQVPFFSTSSWITDVAAPTHEVAVAFAGLDGEIFRYDTVVVVSDTVINDTFYINRTAVLRWDTLNYDFFGTWIQDVEQTEEHITAVGSNLLISDSVGETWELHPPADPQSDRSISFAPDGQHGLVGGGLIDQVVGWARFTDDAGETWSERTLSIFQPVNGVHMVTSEIGYAVGGDINMPMGKIYRTNDGGQTWDLELIVDAELRVISSVRATAAYVHVIAAGAFPDFSGGVWLSRLFLPDTTGAVLVADQDTLDFGSVDAGATDTLGLELSNVGASTIFVNSVISTNSLFQPLWEPGAIELQPDSSVAFDVVFAPDATGEFEGELRILNSDADNVRVFCRGSAGIDAAGPGIEVPGSPSLTVWPNPGNAEFRIGYELAQPQQVTMRIYSLTGRLLDTVVRKHVTAGVHVVNWNASAYASGLYFVRLEAGAGHVLTKKLMLLK